MVEQAVMRKTLNEIKAGVRDCFKELQVLMKGINYNKKIPKSFWEDEEKAGLGIMWIPGPLTKEQLRQIREEIICAIFYRIDLQRTESQNCMKHYLQYFHALTILELPKNSKLVPVEQNNIKYNIAYQLWKLDDGSEENLQIIRKIGKYVDNLKES